MSLLKKIKPKHYPLFAFILTVVTYWMALSFSQLLSTGMYVIVRSDLSHQYLPFAEYFCRVIRSEHDYFYSWTLNLGQGTALLNAYYCLSPFNLIYLIMGEGGELIATALIIILKAGLAAATFQVFISRFLKINYFETVLFSVMYAMCGMQVSYYFIIGFMDAVYIFPLIMLGILRFVRDGQKPWLLFFSYAYIFFVNFYMGYILGVCSFIIFIAAWLYGRDIRDKAANRLIVMRYIVLVLLDLGLTAFIWLPAVGQIFTDINTGSDNLRFTTDPLRTINNLLIGQFQDITGYSPYIYSGLLSALLFFLFIFNDKINKRMRIYFAAVSAVFLAIILSPHLNYFIHAFDKPNQLNFRYSFVISFIVVTAACLQFPYIRISGRKSYLILCGVLALSFAESFLLYRSGMRKDFNSCTLMACLINIIFLALYYLMMKLYKEKRPELFTLRSLLTMIVLAEICINSMIVIHRMESNPMMQYSYELSRRSDEMTIDEIKSNEDDIFYRIDYASGTSNKGFSLDFNQLSNFCSSDNGVLNSALSHLGLGCDETVISDAGLTDPTKLLLNVRYVVNGRYARVEDVLLYGGNIDDVANVYPYEKNEESMAGFVADRGVIDYEAGPSPFENMDRLMSLMTGDEINCFKDEDMVRSIGSDNGRIEWSDDKLTLYNYGTDDESMAEFTFLKEKGEGDLLMYFRPDPDMFLKRGRHMPYLEYHDESKMRQKSEMRYGFAVKAGEINETEEGVKIIFKDDQDRAVFDDVYFARYDRNEFKRAVSLLKGSAFNVTGFSDGYVKGDVDAPKDGVLFLSVPCVKGFRAYVDGKETSIIPLIEDAFIGIDIIRGHHEIELKYTAPGMLAGRIISIACAVILLLIGCIYKKTQSETSCQGNIHQK